jgi:hypothetical protein
MIHFATLHYRSDAWIDLQLTYIERYTSEPYRVYACLDHVDRSHFGKFHHAEHRGERIAPEYDHLARVIGEQADPDDWLVFLHGDTIPIADWVPSVRAMMRRAPLVGIRRDENLGEPHPHACFTVTTPRLWSELGGTWANGPKWTGTTGREVTDLGAVLWRRLEDAGIAWEPLLRSNVRDIHPLWFGVYEDIVYHHGAGFRLPISRVDSDPSADLVRPLQLLVRARIAYTSQFRSRRLYRGLVGGDEFFRDLIADSSTATISSAAAG